MSDSVWPHRWQPPGSPVPGILQARTLEWVAITFSNAWKWKVKVKSLSRVRPSATPWTAAYQAPPSTGFSRQEYWSGCHCLLRLMRAVVHKSFLHWHHKSLEYIPSIRCLVASPNSSSLHGLRYLPVGNGKKRQNESTFKLIEVLIKISLKWTVIDASSLHLDFSLKTPIKYRKQLKKAYRFIITKKGNHRNGLWKGR